MQRKKAEGTARCKRCLKHGTEEVLRREALAAQPHVRWAKPLVTEVCASIPIRTCVHGRID